MPHFKKYKLSELVEKERGISYGVVQPGTFLKEGIPFIRVNNLTENKLSIKDVEKISLSIESKYRRTRLKGTELLVSLVGSLGHIGYVRNHMIGWNVARAIGVLPIKEEYDRDWIYWHLKSPDVQGALYNSATTSVQATINLKELQEIEINYPNEAYRKKATSILSSLDDKIELNRCTNQTLEQIAQTLFKKCFVDDIDPENLPEGWRWGKLGELFTLQRGFDLPNTERNHGKIPVFAASGFNGFHDKSMVKGPGITTGRSGVIGNVFYIIEDFWPLNTSLFIKEFKISSPLHSFYVLKNIDLAGLNTGSAVPTLNRNEVHLLEVMIPSGKIITEFETKAFPVFKLIRENEKQYELLEKIRDSLLPKLMSGEIEVNVTEKN